MTEEKKEQGRPAKYKEECDEQARKLCLLGATDKELADFFNVCEATINNWKIKHSSFLESIKKGKEIADATVAEKLFHRATGYSHEEVKLAQSEGAFTDEKVVTKHYAPDATAAIFWLKNRQPDKWRDKRDVEHSGNVNINDMSEDDLDREIAKLAGKSE